MKLHQVIFATLVMGNCTLSMAEKQTAPTPLQVAAVTYQDSSGVSIEWDADGVNWSKIRSVGEADVMFGDRKDVWDATRKATLQAKADIAKFLKERITSSSLSDLNFLNLFSNSLQKA